jgi:hypothetical protein
VKDAKQVTLVIPVRNLSLHYTTVVHAFQPDLLDNYVANRGILKSVAK